MCPIPSPNRVDGNVANHARLRRARGHASPQPAALVVAVSPPADEEGLTPRPRAVSGGGFHADVALVTMALVRAGAGTDVFQDVTAATDEAQARAGRRVGRDRRPGDVQSHELGAGRGDEGTLAKRAQQGAAV